MYEISNCSSKIRNIQTNEIFVQDDREQIYLTYLVWLKNNGTPERVPFFEDEEHEMKAREFMLKLQYTASELRIKAKAAAIGKTGTDEYIISQQEFYEIKYQQCISTNNSQEIEDLLQNEADEYGITLEQFKALVISRYNEAKEKYNLFMRMIERCRTKIQTLIENKNWANVDIAFAIVDTLNNVEEAQSVMNQILEL